MIASFGCRSCFSGWLAGLPAGAPVVGFGPRRAPGWVLSAASRLGSLVASLGLLAVSGAAAGVDSAFVSAAVSAGGSSRVFRPAPGSGVPGLFARSRQALAFSARQGGGAVVFVPSSGAGGGSAASVRFALALGCPVWVVSFSPSSVASFRFFPPSGLLCGV